MKNGRSGEQGIWRNARVVPVFPGKKKKRKKKSPEVRFVKIVRAAMLKNKEKPVDFKEYKEIYIRFWSKKKSVTPGDIEFMVKLIEERATKT